MKKTFLVTVCIILLVTCYTSIGIAEEKDKVSDLTGLFETCPFTIRNGIRFGMSKADVMALEDGKLELEVTLGGLDGYKLTYSFIEDMLTGIEYAFVYPNSYDIYDSGKYTFGELSEIESWLNNHTLVQQALEKKYGTAINTSSSNLPEELTWMLKYENCNWGVDIKLALDSPSAGIIWRNRVTYTPHNYQADLEGMQEQEQLVEDTSEDL